MGYKVGLTCHKNRQSNRNTSKYMDDRGKEHLKKTASAVFLLMLIFKYGYSVRQHKMGRRDKPDKILQR